MEKRIISLKGITTLLIIIVSLAGVGSAGTSVQDIIGQVHAETSYDSSQSGAQGQDASSQGVAEASAEGMFPTTISFSHSVSVLDTSLTMSFAGASGTEAGSGAGANVESTGSVVAAGAGASIGDYTGGSVISVAGLDEGYNSAGIAVSSYAGQFEDTLTNADTADLAVAWS